MRWKIVLLVILLMAVGYIAWDWRQVIAIMWVLFRGAFS